MRRNRFREGQGAAAGAAASSARISAVALRAAALVLCAAPAAAEEIGRFCTAAACAGATANPWAGALGFAAAALATGWIARRRERA